LSNTNIDLLKIGILTFHRCINYGSYWQARALAEGLQQRGHIVEILDHQSNRVNFAEWKCAMQPVLPTPVPATDRPFYREKMEKFFELFGKLPLSKPFPLDDPSQMDEYDVVVVGSDEVWNLTHPWYNHCPLFYGDGIKARRLISYAASFGNYPSSWGIDPDWAKKLYNFQKISVRDENSWNIIKNAMGFEPDLVLDPCLQFPIHAEKRDLSHIKGPYVAVYGHNFSDYYIRKIKEWATNRNIKLISIGYRNDWADEQWLTADPHDFANFIAGAEAVVTNFFHGCVFALNNQKPFVCETSSYRSIKVQGLLQTVGGEQHLVDESTPSEVYNLRLTAPLNSHIPKRIAELREISDSYIDAALAPKQFELS